MVKDDILLTTRKRIQAVESTMEKMRLTMIGTAEGNVKVDTAARLVGLRDCKDELTRKMKLWEDLPDDQWSGLKVRIEMEFLDMAQDMEERFGRLE